MDVYQKLKQLGTNNTVGNTDFINISDARMGEGVDRRHLLQFWHMQNKNIFCETVVATTAIETDHLCGWSDCSDVLQKSNIECTLDLFINY